MKKISYNIENGLVDWQCVKNDFKKLAPLVSSFSDPQNYNYQTDYAFINQVLDESILQNVEHLSKKLLALNPSMLILIGIGGSNLGAVAVIEALYGNYYNDLDPKIKFYCADTIDDQKNEQLLSIAENELKKGKIIIVALVTNRGKTTETLINGALFLDLLKKYYPEDYQKYAVIISDNDSQLYQIAKEQNYNLLDIPTKVGGRYSVFSAVGLFPLYMLGVDCNDFIKGAEGAINLAFQLDLSVNNASLSALNIYHHYKFGKNIHDMFIFYPNLFSLGLWYKQLTAESLAKTANNGIAVGITPSVSIGTTDLHSMVQLYLGGPRDKFTTFIHVLNEKNKLQIPNNDISKPLSFLAGKSVFEIKNAIFTGVEATYKSEKRPYITIELAEINPYIIGMFMMLKMMETIFLAKLLDINAFDQPAVELYKEQVWQLLK